MPENTILESKLVGDITGTFIIPPYQRGYRWKPEQISMLLEDVHNNGDSSYCLQPIVVVKRGENSYELVDGQQRLTSIYLVFKYIKQMLPSVEQKFSLTYETREDSEGFLESMDEARKSENPDFFHIAEAYTAIDKWFNKDNTDKTSDLYKYFGEKVKVIWYEVEDGTNPIDLFTRLNIGKIPLTNAELIKALFLSRNKIKNVENLSESEQLQIATSWDIIEKELHNESFWAFLTKEDSEQYQTRIELIFNMMAKKESYKKDSYETFFYFTATFNE